jgi:hypothetical protein
VKKNRSARNQNPAIAVIDSVSKENLLELISDAAEFGLDSVLESEELKQIPVIGSLARLTIIGASVRDRLFAQKLLRFLQEVSTVPPEERAKFAEGISSKGNKERAGEALLLLIDRLDHMTKPEIVGKIVRAAILGEIDYESSLRLSAMVERTYFSDLLLLPKAETGMGIDIDVAESLASVGLLHRRVEPNFFLAEDTRNPNLTFYSFSEQGKALVKILEAGKS